MSKDCFDALSAEQRENVRSALVAAFGSDSVGAVTPVAGGITTASTFRVEAGGRRYLLRVEGEPSPLRNPHQYVSMRIATEAGIAPEIHYIDEAARIAVIDFIEQQPLKAYPGGPRALAQALGELLSRVQATPVFPTTSSTMPTSSRACSRMCAGPVCLPPACLMRMWNASNCSAKPTTPARPGWSPATTIPPGQHPVRWRTALADRLGISLSQ